MRFHALQLEFNVRLTGLCGAVHLNSMEGVVRDEDPANHERWKVLLDDGHTCFSVKAMHFTHICRGNYKRASP